MRYRRNKTKVERFSAFIIQNKYGKQTTETQFKSMPLITIEAGKLTEEVKLELIQKLTNMSAEITGIPKEAFFISIREMPDENVAIGGITVKEMKTKAGKV